MSKVSQAFRHFAEATARYSGKPGAFLIAAAMIVVWAATGPLFGFGDTWQLVINTSTTIITFLMVFLIQNSQNREGAALQIKLDELIRATEARNSLLDLENVDEETLDRIRENYRKLAHRREEQAQQGGSVSSKARKQAEAEEACHEVEEIDRELREANGGNAEQDDGAGEEPATDGERDGTNRRSPADKTDDHVSG